MYRFQYEIFFWLLLFVPVMILIWYGFERFRKNRFAQIFSQANLQRLIDGSALSVFRKLPWLSVLAVILLIFALANFQKGTYEFDTARVRGTDILFALDVSKSMNAQDVKPSRMEVSKLLIKRLVDRSRGDKMGLLVFAGDATVLSPLSSDYLTLEEELDRVKPGMARVQGTSISNALDMASISFQNNQNEHKALVLITDGEDHEKGIKSKLKNLESQGIKVFTVGVGSENGATFIDPATGKLQTDRKGEEVVSRMNPEVIKEVATSAGGDYVFLRSINQATSDIDADLASLGTNLYDNNNFQKSKSFFMFFVVCAFVFLLLEYFLPLTVRRFTTVAVLLLAVFSSPSFAQSTTHDKAVQDLIYQGNELIKKKKYEDAAARYTKAIEKSPNDEVARYNLGTTQYLQQNAAEARNSYQQALELTQDPIEKAKTHYNIGNTNMLEKNWDAAIEQYKKSLLLNPNDENVRYNLAYAQKMKKNEKSKDQNQNKNQNSDQQKNKDQQKKDQQNKNAENKDQNKQQQPKPQPKSKMSKEQAERALQNLRNKSKDLKNGDTVDGRPIRVNEKDW